MSDLLVSNSFERDALSRPHALVDVDGEGGLFGLGAPVGARLQRAKGVAKRVGIIASSWRMCSFFHHLIIILTLQSFLHI